MIVRNRMVTRNSDGLVLYTAAHPRYWTQPERYRNRPTWELLDEEGSRGPTRSKRDETTGWSMNVFDQGPLPSQPGPVKEKAMERYNIDPGMVRDACREVVSSLRGVIKEHARNALLDPAGSEGHPFAHQRQHQEEFYRRVRADEAERALRRTVTLAFHQPTSYGG